MQYNIDLRITGYYTAQVEADSLAEAVSNWQKVIDEIDLGRIDSPEIEPISCYEEE